ncbi:MAG: glycerol-3-phosphate 1-O-acyltransferase PlsY [Firmicutes bacterium]|nr:glycerol-3-phosphate 1-O-acyltransferase PlsY [Bacillota bacterium]
MFRIYSLLIGYLFGCFQSAYIIGRLKGIDIREHGSGNAGFTNTTRVLGKDLGYLVFFLDTAKVIWACVIVSLIFHGTGTFTSGFEGSPTGVLPCAYAGIGAILGHIFPFYLGFRGGKGIASSLALMLCIDWKVALITFAVGIALVAWKRIISLTSLVMLVVYPVTLVIFHYDWEVIALICAFTVLTYIKHIPNIKRLLNGTESRFGYDKNAKQEEVQQ